MVAGPGRTLCDGVPVNGVAVVLYARHRSWEVSILNNRRLRRGRGIWDVARALERRRLRGFVAGSMSQLWVCRLSVVVVVVVVLSPLLRQDELLLMPMFRACQNHWTINRKNNPTP